MFDFFRNIQSRPTPILFIKKRNRDLFYIFYAIVGPASLASSVLRYVVVSLGNFVLGNNSIIGSLTSSLLRSVVVNVGSYANAAMVSPILSASLLLQVVFITSVGNYDNATEVSSSLTSSTLLTVVRTVGNYNNEAQIFGIITASTLA